MIKKLFGTMIRQKNIGRQWGSFVLVVTQMGIFTSSLTLLLVAINAYGEISGWLRIHGVTMPFWVFIVGIFGLMVVVFPVLAWKFLLPSYYSSSNEQFFRHNNPIMKDMEELKKNNAEMKELLEELVKKQR